MKKIIFLLCLFATFTTNAFELLSPVREAGLMYGTLSHNERLFYKDIEITPTPNGDFFFAIPKGVEPIIELTLMTKENEKEKIAYKVQLKEWEHEDIKGLPQNQVELDETTEKRLRRENTMIKEARKKVSTDFFSTCFVHPLKQYKRISGSFGIERRLNDAPITTHSGTDYAAATGTPTYAIADGRVALVAYDMFLSGNTLIIDHGYGLYSSYSHLDSIDVHQNDFVYPGQQVGTVGATGRATGPHLHFVLTWKGIRPDPEQVFSDFACKK